MEAPVWVHVSAGDCNQWHVQSAGDPLVLQGLLKLTKVLQPSNGCWALRGSSGDTEHLSISQAQVGVKRKHWELEELSPRRAQSWSGWAAQGQTGTAGKETAELCFSSPKWIWTNRASFHLLTLGTGSVAPTAPAVCLMLHLLESRFSCQNCLCLDVSAHLPSSVAFRCCSYTYQSHSPLSFQSDSPVLSKQEETLLKSSITFLFSSSIPAQTRGDNTESFKYLIYKEKSLLKRDQLMHF